MKSERFSVVCLILLSFLFFGSQKYYAQIVIPIKTDLQNEDRTWYVNDILDSIMNKRQFNAGGIIYVTESSVVIDTVVTGQVRRVENDSVILGKFLKKNQKKISSKEFWGVITLSGYCQRFYGASLFEVWESPSPYIYKLEGDFKTAFYFSENLLSPLYSLDRSTIQNAALDTSAKRILNQAMDDRVKNYQYQLSDQKRAVVADISINLALVILQVMLSGGGSSHTHSSSSSSSNHQAPRSTGPRR
ncbi:hypothetical protein CNR22_16525 [Sphingobacteriaceae bacterium]|nr:hypothetical protein CNR22_16525 [Sphingobacteriaceae bacterium]